MTIRHPLRKLAVVALLPTLLTGTAQAGDSPDKHSLVVLVWGVSLEQFMGDAQIQTLVRAGGVGLMSTRVAEGDRGLGAYVTLGAGARAAGPALLPRMWAPGQWRRGPSVFSRVVDLNEGGTRPFLLGSVLSDAGVSACVNVTQMVRPEDLVAMNSEGTALTEVGPDCGLTVLKAGDLASAAAEVSAWLGMVLGGDLQVIVVAPKPSEAMDMAGDELTPIVVVEGSADEMFPTSGAMHTLTSDTTQRTGVVSNEDVAPTILDFFGLPVPAEMKGQPIRVVDAPVPFGLHERYLAERQMHVPVGAASGIALAIIIIVGLVVFFRRDRIPSWTLAVGRWTCFAVPSLGVALLAAGHLPTLTYVWAGLLAAAITVLLPMAALAFRRRGPLAPPFVFGLLVLAFFVFEALSGWYGTMFTFLGSTALDGGRFYGLSNVETGLLLGSALFVAASLRPWKGFAVIVALALFAGLPGRAANLGAAVTIFAAAGLWLALRVRGRFGWKEAALAVLTVVVGTAVVLAAHRFLAGAPTHGTRFVEAVGSDPFQTISTTLSRLEIGIRLLHRNPIGISYLIATPVLIWIVTMQSGGLRASFDHETRWRTAILVILWASVVGYFAEDTGVAAVGLGFAMALGGTLYLPLALLGVPFEPEAAKMETS